MSKKSIDQLCEYVKTNMNMLFDIWREIGFEGQSFDDRCLQAFDHCKNVLDRMINEEQQLKEEYKKICLEWHQEITKLSNILGCEPLEIDIHSNLLKAFNALKCKKEKLAIERDNRMEDFIALQKQESTLCKQMEFKRYKIDREELPTSEVLENYRTYINSLEEEKKKRISRFNSLRKQILHLYEIIEYTPQSELEKKLKLSSNDHNNVAITDIHLKDLEELYENLKFQRIERETKINGLVEKLKEVWKRLEKPVEYQNKFLSAHRDLKQSTYQAIESEYVDCRSVLTANMEKYLEKLRWEIRELWEQCYVHEEAKSAFPQLYSTDFTEELIDEHEKEIQKWKCYLVQTESLRNMIEERNALWDKMIHLEHQAKDVNRFKNRGGNLLLEEKERKRVAIKLPKLEHQINMAISDWETRHNRPFIYHSGSFHAFIQEQWANYHYNKEIEKENRNKVRKETTKLEMTYGTKPLTPGPSSILLHSASKSRNPLTANNMMATNSYYGSLANLYNLTNQNNVSNSNMTAALSHQNLSRFKKLTSTQLDSPTGSITNRNRTKPNNETIRNNTRGAINPGGIVPLPAGAKFQHSSLKNLQNRQVINKYKKRSSRILRQAAAAGLGGNIYESLNSGGGAKSKNISQNFNTTTSTLLGTPKLLPKKLAPQKHVYEGYTVSAPPKPHHFLGGGKGPIVLNSILKTPLSSAKKATNKRNIATTPTFKLDDNCGDEQKILHERNSTSKNQENVNAKLQKEITVRQLTFTNTKVYGPMSSQEAQNRIIISQNKRSSSSLFNNNFLNRDEDPDSGYTPTPTNFTSKHHSQKKVPIKVISNHRQNNPQKHAAENIAEKVPGNLISSSTKIVRRLEAFDENDISQSNMHQKKETLANKLVESPRKRFKGVFEGAEKNREIPVECQTSSKSHFETKSYNKNDNEHFFDTHHKMSKTSTMSNIIHNDNPKNIKDIPVQYEKNQLFNSKPLNIKTSTMSNLHNSDKSDINPNKKVNSSKETYSIHSSNNTNDQTGENDTALADSYSNFTSGLDKKDVPFCHSSQMEDDDQSDSQDLESDSNKKLATDL